MSLPREQKKSQPPWQELALLVGAVAFVFYSVQSFLAVREPLRPGAVKLEAPLPLPAPERAPASASSSGSTEVKRIPCLLAGAPKMESAARFLQIASTGCGDKISLNTWRGRNATTGEEILVFPEAGKKGLVTSFFTVNPELNELVFEQDSERGRGKTVKITIVGKSGE